MYDWVVVMDCCCEELWWLYVVVTLCCGDFKVWWLYVSVTLCFGDLMLWWLYVVMILKYCECIYCGNFMVCANFRCDFLVWWHDVMNSYCDDFHVVVTVKSTCCGSLMLCSLLSWDDCISGWLYGMRSEWCCDDYVGFMWWLIVWLCGGDLIIYWLLCD